MVGDMVGLLGGSVVLEVRDMMGLLWGRVRMNGRTGNEGM